MVYLISCKVCGFQYVGSTTTKFRLRFNNHKSRLRAHSRMSAVNKESNNLIYKQFYSHGHHGLQDVSIQLIDKVSAKDDLLAKEGQWAYPLRSLKPNGLNESVFFFSQNREGNVAESKILFLIQNYLLHLHLVGNLSAIFPYLYTYFPFSFSVTHILSVRMLSFGTRLCCPLARADVTYV